mgnify:CR=1 FL=1
MLRRLIQSDNETARGISWRLRQTCVATLAVSPFGDVKMLDKKKINLLAPRLCKCGCGEEVKPGRRLIYQHQAQFPICQEGVISK